MMLTLGKACKHPLLSLNRIILHSPFSMVSILILTHDEGKQLEAHLPALLSQQGADYEVIVVDMHSEDDTVSTLQVLEEQHKHLRHLSMPTSKDISQERLALHLGMRAAVASRVLLMDADTYVPSDHWLCDVLHAWPTESEMLLIPTKRERAKAWRDYFSAGHEAWHNRLFVRQVSKHGLYRMGNAIVALKKDTFLRAVTPANLLALKTGTMDIYVANTANQSNTTCITDTELHPCRDANPSSHWWSQRRLFEEETSRHFPRRLLRNLTYLQHSFCTLHRGALLYSLQDLYTRIRWRFTSKRAFIKKHY